MKKKEASLCNGPQMPTLIYMYIVNEVLQVLLAVFVSNETLQPENKATVLS